MKSPAFLKPDAEGVILSLKVHPRASRNEIGEAVGSELKVKVTAPPVDAAANEAVVRFLADVLGCSKGAVKLLRGRTSRHKQIRITGLSLETIAGKLER